MSSESIYYVYIYRDPETHIPFYVGYGKNLRAFSHLNEAKKNPIPISGQHKLNKIRKILTTGNEPIIEIYYDGLSKDEACQIEIALIAKFGRIDLGTGTLTNKTLGGDGNRGWSNEDREAMSNAKRGYATVKDLSTNESFVVKTDDPRLLSGELVGVAHGSNSNINGSLDNYILTRDPTTDQTFRVHSSDERWISGKLVGFNKGKPANENVKRAARARKGIPKSKEHNKKVSDSNTGLKWIHNFDTGVTSRVRKDVMNPPDGFVFVNGPFKLKTDEQLHEEKEKSKIEKQKRRQENLSMIRHNNSVAQKKFNDENPLHRLSDDDIRFYVKILKIYSEAPNVDLYNSCGRLLSYDRAFAKKYSIIFSVSLHTILSLISGKKYRVVNALRELYPEISAICEQIINKN